MAASAASWSATRAPELLVTNTTRRPDAAQAGDASTEPGIGWWASQTTPSRSQSTARRGPRPAHRTGGPPRRGTARMAPVPRFEPFRAVRYAPAVDLDAVIAPPYDVLSDADVDALAARDPHNIVHVDVPRGGADRYDVAGRPAARRGSPTA